MYLAGIDKHDIIFFELIAASLNAVGYITTQMNQDFVEIMIVEIYIQLVFIFEMKYFKRLRQVAGFCIIWIHTMLLW